MLSVSEATEKFKAILESKSAWKSMKDTQLVEMLAAFQGVCMRDFQFEAERYLQETSFSKALNRSSIIAKAEDKEYLPRKRTPSDGEISIENKGDAEMSLPSGTEIENSEGIVVTLTDAISLESGATGTVTCDQKQYVEYTDTVSVEQAYYEYLFDSDISVQIAEFAVYLDINDDNGFQLWEYATLFQNTDEDSLAYDEIYTSDDRVGIRFGNGTFGLIPPAGSEIKIEAWLTEGDTFMAVGQELFLVSEVLDVNYNPVDLKIKVSTAIQGGLGEEDIEDIRKSLHYWPIYNNQLVWDDDYEFFSRRNFPQIRWFNVWGERKAEEQAGAASVEFINKLFISAYAEEGEDISDSLIELLDEKGKKINKTFEWVDPIPVTFTVSITGKVEKSRDKSLIQTKILEQLDKYYGADSEDRKDEVDIDEMYALVKELGYFSNKGEKFVITISGTPEATLLEHFVAIDLDNSSVVLEYK